MKERICEFDKKHPLGTDRWIYVRSEGAFLLMLLRSEVQVPFLLMLLHSEVRKEMLFVAMERHFLQWNVIFCNKFIWIDERFFGIYLD